MLPLAKTLKQFLHCYVLGFFTEQPLVQLLGPFVIPVANATMPPVGKVKFRRDLITDTAWRTIPVRIFEVSPAIWRSTEGLQDNLVA